MNYTELADKYLKSEEYSLLSNNSKVNYASKIKALKGLDGLYSQINTLPVSNSTKNVYISVNKTVWSWGIDMGYDVEEPKRPRKTLKVTNKDRNVYTKEEIMALCDAAESPQERLYANFLKACFFTGCRPSELYNLTWEQVSPDFINLVSTKRQEVGQIGRKCAIIPEIQACLDFAKHLWMETSSHFTTNDKVFRSMNSPQLNPTTTRKAIKALHNKINMPHKQLRHARAGLATAMLEKGYSIYDIQGQLGHASVGTTERYLRPSLEYRANRYHGI
jgi:integrase